MSLDPDLPNILHFLGTGAGSSAQLLGMHPVVLDRLITHAVGLMNQGKRQDGEAVLAAIIDADPTSAKAAFALGASRAERGEHGGAIEAYSLAIGRADAAVAQRLFFCRAQSFAGLGLPVEARADLRAAATGPDPNVCQDAAGWLKNLEDP